MNTTKRLNLPLLLAVCCLACLMLPSMAFAQAAPVCGVPGTPACTPTPRPTDRPTETPRPTEAPQQPTAQPQHPTTIPQEPTAVPTIDPASVVNPLRASSTGPCQLSTYATVRVNVRETPSMDAPVMSALDPNVLYPVLEMAEAEGAVWYRVEAGWVSGSAVVAGGDCTALEGETSGLMPTEKCVTLPGGQRFCYLTLTAFAPDNGGTEGLQPQTGCVDFDGAPICFTILVGVAPEGSTGGLVPTQKCGTLPDGTRYCFDTLTAYIPDDGATEGLQPQTVCVDTAAGVPFCHLTLVAVAEEGATEGLQPQNKCVDLQGAPICFTILVGTAPDGSTGGFVPTEKCGQLPDGTRYCFDTLTAYIPDDGATEGLQPETECFEVVGTHVCIDKLVAVAEEGETEGLQPETECFDVVGTRVCIDTLVAVAEEGETEGLQPETECVQLQGTSVCYLTLTAVADDGSTEGLQPGHKCVALPDGKPFCYPVLIASADDNATRP